MNQSINKSSPLENVSRVCVVGLGETGRSCLRYLSAKGLEISAIDSNKTQADLASLRNEFRQVKFYSGELTAEVLTAAQLIVLSPGVPRAKLEALQSTEENLPIVGDIELFAHECDPAKVISITGSNGKSTVTALCGAILDSAMVNVQIGGNYGKPALDLLAEQADVYVLELSSFQLESTYSLNSTVATILNLSPDHMDRYESFEQYIAAKQSIYHGAQTVIYNRADKQTLPKKTAAKKQISFGLDAPSDERSYGIKSFADRDWLCRGDEKIVAVDRLKLKGQHNQLNVLAAMALVDVLDIDAAVLSQAVSEFTGLPHRFEWLGRWRDVDWVNDSKGTNPGATLASIQGQQQAVVLIAGGDAKGADFAVLTQALKDHVKAVVLFGRDAGLIEAILPKGLLVSRVEQLEQTIAEADHYAAANDLVLFSPACASFDQFSNYAQRGDVFKSAVQEYFA